MDEKRFDMRLKMAQDMGYDIENPRAVDDLITCIKYCDLKFSNRRLTDDDIAERLGITKRLLVDIKTRDAIRVATKIALSEFLNDGVRTDIRAELFQIYQDNLPAVARNMSQIAKGAQIGVDAKGNPIHAPFRDQVSAATLLLNNPLGNAFLANTFAGEMQSLEETAHLELRQNLLARGQIVDLDSDVVDADVKKL